MNNSNVVEIRQVSKDYENGQVKALRSVDLDVKNCSFLALAGPSGSGKTTLLNVIGALDIPDNGSVTINGKKLEDLNEKERTRLRRETIGFVFQQFNLVPVLTAVENVELPLEIMPGTTKESRRTMAIEMLKRVGLEGLEHRYPKQLSGGQQQRVAVARALVKRPNLVLADEPTANLDGESGASIIDLMKRMRDELDTAFIFSTHDPRLLERAETIIKMEDGCVI